MGGRGFQEFPSLAGIHVLLVEDEPDARELLAAVIEYAEGLVTAVGSADAALRTLKRVRPDLLLVDIVMPGHDGYWLLEHARALDQGAIPAIAVTGHTRVHDRVRAARAGFRAHLAKPVDPLELCRLIRDVARNA
jgi:CheY-like chemotaxis protein